MLPNEKSSNTKYLENIINDLILSLNMWIGGYPLDDNHITKQKELIKRGYRAIGTPLTMEEMKVTLLYMRCK